MSSVNVNSNNDHDDFMAGATSKIVPDTGPSSVVGSSEAISVFLQEDRQNSPVIPIQGAPKHSNITSFDNLVAVFGEDKQKVKKTKIKRFSPKLPHRGSLLGIFYGIILVILGVAFPTKEALQGRWLQDYIPAVYFIYLYGVGFIYLVTLEIYLVCLDRRNKTKQNETRNPAPLSCPNISRISRLDPGFVNLGFEGEDKTRNVNVHVARPVSARESRYSNRSEGAISGDSTAFEDAAVNAFDNKETTLYIRVVVIVLGLAAMVYDGLLVKQLQERQSPSACGIVTIFWPRIVHIAFLLVQCYFVFKHAQVNILSNNPAVRLGFIHVLATNVIELVRAFISQSFNRQVYHMNTATNRTMSNCILEEDILYRAAPYLYPCVIEYNFLAAALIYFMFTSLDDSTIYCSPQPADRKNLTEVNCQRTHKGLFFGIVVFAGTGVSVILFFSYLRMAPGGHPSLLIYQITDISLHGILMLSLIVAWIQIGKLSFLVQIELAFEDGVLLISMSLGILFYVFQLMPALASLVNGVRTSSNVLSLTGSVLAMATGVMQTSFMIDLSCRYLTLDEEWDKKPGRGCIMFILLTNLSIWLLKSFQIKALELESGSQADTYGYLSWQLMIHAFVPFLIYYYLFSSACLAKTWQQIYRNPVVDKSGLEFSPRHERYSTPAKEFEYVRHRKVPRAGGPNVRIDLDAIVSPVSDV